MHRSLSLLLLVLVLNSFPPLASAERVGDAIHATLASTSPNQYMFRGLVLKDKGPIGQASSDLVIDLYSSDSFRFGVPVGFWLSLHPGDKAGRAPGPGPAAWYESRIDGGLQLGISDLTLDGRFVVYSSPNGSFEDIYELRGAASYSDESLFVGDNKKAIFRGFFPKVTLAVEAKGARDGQDSGMYGELALAPRTHLLEGVALGIDFVLPMSLGMSLSKYYEFAETKGGPVKDHALGFASLGVLFDIEARFVPVRLGLYNIRLRADGVLPMAQRDAYLSKTDTIEVVASAETVLRF